MPERAEMRLVRDPGREMAGGYYIIDAVAFQMENRQGFPPAEGGFCPPLTKAGRILRRRTVQSGDGLCAGGQRDP